MESDWTFEQKTTQNISVPCLAEKGGFLYQDHATLSTSPCVDADGDVVRSRSHGAEYIFAVYEMSKISKFMEIL